MSDISDHVATCFREPAMFRELLHGDRAHRKRRQAQFAQWLRACCAQHKIFGFADGRGALDALVQVPVPIDDVLLPTGEVAAALLDIFFAGQNIEAVDRMESEVGHNL
jgi:hypothetical protein